MKSHAPRLYVVSVTLLVFFVLWVAIAAKPWVQTSAAAKPARDPRLVALERKQRRLSHEAQVVNRMLQRRWRRYHARLRAREARIRALTAQHAQAVAAAAAAASASAAVPVASAAPAYTSSAPAATRVVTLPPKVTVVTLPPSAPPATSSGSSHP